MATANQLGGDPPTHLKNKRTSLGGPMLGGYVALSATVNSVADNITADALAWQMPKAFRISQIDWRCSAATDATIDFFQDTDDASSGGTRLHDTVGTLDLDANTDGQIVPSGGTFNFASSTVRDVPENSFIICAITTAVTTGAISDLVVTVYGYFKDHLNTPAED